MGPVRLWLRYAATSLRGQMQYPASTFGLILGQFAVTVIELTAVFALFDRFGLVKGWSLGEMGMFYGLTHISFAISELLTRGFDVFGPAFVKTGNFDTLAHMTSLFVGAVNIVRLPPPLLRNCYIEIGPARGADETMGHQFQLMSD